MVSDQEGYATFSDYVKFLDSLVNGGIEAKAKISFKLLDIGNKGFFLFEDVTHLLTKIMQSSAESSRYPIEKKASIMAEYMFKKMKLQNHDMVAIRQFIAAVKRDSTIIDFFTLPASGLSDIIIATSKEKMRLERYSRKLKAILGYLEVNQQEKKVSQTCVSIKSERNLSENLPSINDHSEIMAKTSKDESSSNVKVLQDNHESNNQEKKLKLNLGDDTTALEQLTLSKIQFKKKESYNNWRLKMSKEAELQTSFGDGQRGIDIFMNQKKMIGNNLQKQKSENITKTGEETQNIQNQNSLSNSLGLFINQPKYTPKM